MRGGEVGGTQWERFDVDNQMLYIDRVIDRVDKTLLEKLPKMDVKFRFPNLFPRHADGHRPQTAQDRGQHT